MLALPAVVQRPLVQLPVPTHLAFVASRVRHVSHPHRYLSDTSRIAVDARTLVLPFSSLAALQAMPNSAAAKTVSLSCTGFLFRRARIQYVFILVTHSLFSLRLLYWVSFLKKPTR